MGYELHSYDMSSGVSNSTSRACPACQSRWRVWPFAWPAAEASAHEGARAVAAGAGSGAAGVAVYPGLSGRDRLPNHPPHSEPVLA